MQALVLVADCKALKRVALSPVTAPGRRVLPHSYWPSKGEHQ